MRILISNAGYSQKIHVQPCTRCHLATGYYEGAGRSKWGAQTQGRAAPGTGTAHSVADSVSYLSAMMDANTDTNYSESAYAATTDSKSYKETRKPRGCERHKSKSRQSRCKKDKKGAKKQQKKNTCPHCIKFNRIKPHCVSKDKCMWNKKYEGY